MKSLIAGDMAIHLFIVEARDVPTSVHNDRNSGMFTWRELTVIV